ncbi:hypothetical protein BBP40_003326 [Aspergillus hancockii]|nr:hypothetical protein BBP40_003326 [Aspergillus hancockii]
MAFSPSSTYLQFLQMSDGSKGDCRLNVLDELLPSLSPPPLAPPGSEQGPWVSSSSAWGGTQGVPPSSALDGPGWPDSLGPPNNEARTSSDGIAYSPPPGLVADRPGVATTGNVHQGLWPVGNFPKPTTRRRTRRQNRSCDPCRLAKRACDLPPGVAIQGKTSAMPCTMCSLRSTECTVAWLASRDVPHPTQKRARSSRRAGDSNTNVHQGQNDHEHRVHRASVSPSAEWDRAKGLVARELLSQQLYLYIDIVEMPLAACLSQRCMPPCYSLGITALTPLMVSTIVSPYLDRARSMITTCWDMNVTSWMPTSVTPQICLAVSVLDTLFQHPEAPPNANLRDTAIAETYKWVAIAAAAQFRTHENDRGEMREAHSQAKDLAIVAWKRAREMLLLNIGATRSFRLALSLLLFGAILPPTGLEQSTTFAEDAAYATREGAQRLRALSANARLYLQRSHGGADFFSNVVGPGTGRQSRPVQALPCEEEQNILELLGAIEWLLCISHSATIVTCRQRPTNLDLDSARIDKLPLRGPGQLRNRDETQTTRHEQELEDTILTRARAQPNTVTGLWWQEASSDLLDPAVHYSGSIAVLLWRSLAFLTLASPGRLTGRADYAEFQRHYTATTTLIAAWRSTFGPINRATITSLQRSPADLRRSVLFCATDGELAILEFDEIVRELDAQLPVEPLLPPGDSARTEFRSTKAYRQEQRLMSATHIAYLASTNIGILNRGSERGGGWKANVQGIGAHPVRVDWSVTAEP